MIDIFPYWADAIGPGLLSILFVAIIVHSVVASLVDRFLK